MKSFPESRSFSAGISPKLTNGEKVQIACLSGILGVLVPLAVLIVAASLGVNSSVINYVGYAFLCPAISTVVGFLNADKILSWLDNTTA